jgi:tetratricopeptide (TPR) repeat protein
MQISAPAWVSALCDELRRRWRDGDRVSVEHYLRGEPRLASCPEALLALIDAEAAARRDAGEACLVDDLSRRFPQLSKDLQQLLAGDLAASETKTWAPGAAPVQPPVKAETPGGAALVATVIHPGPATKGDPAPTNGTESPRGDREDATAEPTPPLPANVRPTLSLPRNADLVKPDSPGAELERTRTHMPGGGDTEEPLPMTLASGAPPPLSSLGLPKIGGYVVLGELGKGGMGVVYKAEQAGLKRLVALKMILSGAGARSEELMRFRREAEAIARIKHPNIVQVYEIGEHEGQPYFSLEFVDGGSLAGRLKESLMPAAEAARLCEKIGRAIHAAHEAGIVHRDLKPANVLMTADGTPKVTDFGLAKQLDEGVEQTHHGAVMGTPAYMAPEQAEGRVQDIGPPADTYALGGLLYEMLVGRPPFKATSLIDTLNQVKYAEPVPPSRLQSKLPRDLETICLKCLAKDPRKRYASAAAMADDLHRFLTNEPIQARRTPLLERGTLWIKRNPWKAGALAAAAIALLIGVGFVSREVGRRVRLARSRMQTQQLLLQAQDDQKNQRFEQAEGRLREALGAIGQDEALADLRPAAEAAHAEVQAELARQALARQHQDQYREFLKDRRTVHQNEALVALDQGQDNAARVRETRAAALRATALYDVTLQSHGRPSLDHLALPDRQKADIIPACYEVLLAGAEAQGFALPGEDVAAQAQEALRWLDRAAELGIASRAFHLERARFLAQAGRNNEAAREEQQAKVQASSGAADLFLMGRQYYRDFLQAPAAERSIPLQEAAEVLEKALEAKPDHFWASYFLALCHLQQGRFDAAEARLSQCIALLEDLEFPWPYILRGFAHSERGHARGQAKEFRAAEADFARAETMNPDKPARYGILVNRAMCHYMEADSSKDAALRALKYIDAIDELKRAIALQPDKPEAHANLAEIFFRQNRLTEAEQEFDRVIELKPQPTWYRSRARLHLKREEYTEALHDLREAIAREGVGQSRNQAEDYVEVGRILFRQKKFAEALAAYDDALKTYPGDYAAAHRLKAEALIELNQFAEAVTELDAYLKGAGKPVADVFRARGLAHAKLRQYDRGVEDYTQALDIDSREGRPPDPKTLKYRGWAYLLCDAPRLGLADFELVLKTTPHDSDALAGRGNARVRLGNTKDALADAEAALREGESSDRLRFNAARVYALAAGRAELDARDIKDPVSAERAVRQQRRRCEDRAVRLLEEALRLVPERDREAFWKQYVDADPALKPIRKTSGYQRLSALYARGTK